MALWNRAERLAELASRVRACKTCPLADTRLNVVFGSGNPNADVLFVGEAPGETEDKVGEAFVGDAGDMLNKVLEKSGWSRDEIVITKVVHCRPIDMNGNNRPPTKQEIQSCSRWLSETIYIVDPIVIIAAGRIPTMEFGKFKKLGDATREMFDTRITGQTGIELIYPVMSIHHPSDLLRRAHHYDIYQMTVDQMKHLRKTVDAFRKLGRNKPTEQPAAGQQNG